MSILPRRLAADGPEEGADGEEDGLENEVEKAAEPPEEVGDFLFEELGDLDEFLAAVALDGPRVFTIPFIFEMQ